MKKTLIALMLAMLFTQTAFAWDDCPFGQVDDPYPGDCGRYVDTDEDYLCDHSQLAPEDRETPELIAQISDVADSEPHIELTEEISTPGIHIEKGEKLYDLVPISVVLIIMYIISHILSKKKIISIMKHRQFWNALLLIAFLISGILGILLVIKINFGLTMSLPFDIVFWHVEMGIGMVVISIFHILWHLSYFKNLFKIKKSV
jgi:hypothetical protein